MCSQKSGPRVGCTCRNLDRHWISICKCGKKADEKIVEMCKNNMVNVLMRFNSFWSYCILIDVVFSSINDSFAGIEIFSAHSKFQWFLYVKLNEVFKWYFEFLSHFLKREKVINSNNSNFVEHFWYSNGILLHLYHFSASFTLGWASSINFTSWLMSIFFESKVSFWEIFSRN